MTMTRQVGTRQVGTRGVDRPLTDTGVRADHTPVLLYHSVNDAPRSWIAPYTVSRATFARHLDLVAHSGREAITVSELVRRRAQGTPCGGAVVLTFDDGFADTLDAAEMLAAAGLPATAYVTTGALQGRGTRRAWEPLAHGRFLTWDQVPQLEEAGVELGAHSCTHRQLDLLRTSAARAEIARSKRALEELLGHPVASFAYPHGHAGRRIRSLTRDAGFTSACSVRNALSPQSDDPYRIARLTVTADTPDAAVAAWLQGEGAPVGTRCDHWRALLGRWVRRLHPRNPVITVAESPTTAQHAT